MNLIYTYLRFDINIVETFYGNWTFRIIVEFDIHIFLYYLHEMVEHMRGIVRHRSIAVFTNNLNQGEEKIALK